MPRDLGGRHARQHFFLISRAHREPDIPVEPREAGENAAQQGVGKGALTIHRERVTFVSPRLRQPLFEPARVGEQAPRVSQKGFPCWVGVSAAARPFGRSNRLVEASFSRQRIWELTEGCAMPRRRAAAAKPPVSATAMKTCNRLNVGISMDNQ